MSARLQLGPTSFYMTNNGGLSKNISGILNSFNHHWYCG